MSELDGTGVDYNDADFLETQRKIEELEQEAEKLRHLEAAANDVTGGMEGMEGMDMEQDEGIDTAEVDRRSVYVGSVDYGATPQELQEHFRSCGTINRITILVDKYMGTPKGFAYVEFADEGAVSNAILLNDTMFRGRQIKVSAKRTNLPGMNRRGRGGRGGRGARGGAWAAAPMGGPMMGMWPRGRGRGRGRGAFFRPY
jgi:polyadenylate-binding protein 2